MPPKRQPRRQTRRGAPKQLSSERVASEQPATEGDTPPGLAAQDGTEQPRTAGDIEPEQQNMFGYDLSSEGPIVTTAESESSLGDSLIPQSQATEAPARRPVQRLASLRNPSHNDAGGSLSSSAATRPAGLRFQPKSVQRRSKEEREAAERAEAERLQARLSGSVVPADLERGGFASRGSGRGAIRGVSDRLSGAGASGHLGGSTRKDEVARPVRGRSMFGGRGEGVGGVSRGSGRGRGRGGTIGTDPGTTGAASSRQKKGPAVKAEIDRDGVVVADKATTKKKIKKESGLIYGISSSESENDGKRGRRINIEEINLVSSESEADGEDTAGKTKERARTPKARNPRPVRFHRDEHVERAVGVNTDPTTLTSAELRRKAKEKQDAQGSMFIDSGDDAIAPSTKTKGRGKTKDVEFIEDKRKWKGVYQDDDAEDLAKVKEEPMDDDPLIDTNATSLSTAQLAGEIPSVNVQEVERETDEDHEEWARYKEDISWMHDTLMEAGGIIRSKHGLKSQDEDNNMDIDIGSIGPCSEAGHIFLFQFPPVLPTLVDARSKKQEGIKNEKKDEPIPAPAPTIEAPPPTEIPTPSNSKKPPPPKPPKAKAPPAKDAKPAPPPPPQTYTPLSPAPPPGQFGTLRLHRSKRVTANWGTLQFDIGRSSERIIAQEVVVCDWNRTVVKKEGFEGSGGLGGGSGGKVKGEDGDGNVKVEERVEWRDEVNCGEKVWAVGGVQGGWVGVPDLGGMFGV
ncbi:hypothetical protein G7Y79_00027g060790 [Physcia stellaris]|nr:hypothetical protein G7Y79_00027g060790 [Physcia stellaris]